MTKIKDLVEKYGNREIDEVELEKILKPVKVKTIYNLETGDIYYWITNNGRVDKFYWRNDSFDRARLAFGNAFLTQEDCEFAIEKLKVEAELKRYASMCEEPLDWNNKEQKKYYLQYNHTDREVDTTFEWSWSTCDIYFTDISILKQAINEIGKERIIKYYLGLKV